MQTISLSELIAARIAAKRIEDEAIAERRLIDKQIADMLKDPAKPEGSISQRTEGCKVTVTYKIDRKVDTDALTSLTTTALEAETAQYLWSYLTTDGAHYDKPQYLLGGEWLTLAEGNTQSATAVQRPRESDASFLLLKELKLVR